MLTQGDLLISEPTDTELKERVLRVIVSVNLRSYEKDIKAIWNRFVENKDLADLISDLDVLFIDQELYHEVEEEEEINPLDMIREEEVQLVCYQWFKPE